MNGLNLKDEVHMVGKGKDEAEGGSKNRSGRSSHTCKPSTQEQVKKLFTCLQTQHS